MVTPELLEYIRVEIAKGKTREETHTTLISSGGWNEADLSEAFRTIIPMQAPIISTIQPIIEPEKPSIPILIPNTPSPALYSSPFHSISSSATYSPSPSLLNSIPDSKSSPSSPSSPSSNSSLWQNLIFIVLGLVCVVSWYFYQPQITNFWNNGVESSRELSINSWNSLVAISKKVSFPSFSLPTFDFKLPTFDFKLPTFDFKLPTFDFGKIFNTDNTPVVNTPVVNTTVVNTPVVNNIVKETINTIKDCGTSVAPKLDDFSSKKDLTLACLGASALNCENAKGVLKDDFFPTIFEIIKLPDSCNFKLSYEKNSTLTDITGNKLAEQYITCPLSIVKVIDNTQSTIPRFIAPDKTDLSKYGSQIYFYGTLGLFIENNLDQNKIQGLSCDGEYIQSMIASYNLSQKK